jgi:hypothetical protein
MSGSLGNTLHRIYQVPEMVSSLSSYQEAEANVSIG